MSNSNPGLVWNQVLSPGQWNNLFSGKQDWSTILDQVIAQGGALAPATPGTWTPTDASGASLTFTGISSTWSSFGNYVFCGVALTFPTTANTMAAMIGGLPFPVPNKAYAQGGFLGVTYPSGVVFLAFPVINSSNIAFLNTSTGAGVTNATLSAKTVYFQAVYPLS